MPIQKFKQLKSLVSALLQYRFFIAMPELGDEGQMNRPRGNERTRRKFRRMGTRQCTSSNPGKELSGLNFMKYVPAEVDHRISMHIICIFYFVQDYCMGQYILLTLTRVARVKRSSASVCASVCLCVCPHDRTKRLKLQPTNLSHGQSIMSPSYPLNIRSKVQRSRSQGHKVQKPISVEGDRVTGVSLYYSIEWQRLVIIVTIVIILNCGRGYAIVQNYYPKN